MLFAAGRGSRLQPLTDKTPKPLIDVGGSRLIDRLLAQLAAAKVPRTVVNVHHLGSQILDHLAARANALAPMTVHGIEEPQLLETGAGLLNARALLASDPVWTLNGDVLLELPLDRFPRRLSASEDLHLLLVPTPSHRAAGDFNARAGRVTERGDRYVFAGLSLLSMTALATFAAGLEKQSGDPFSLQGFLFDRVQAGRVGATIHSGSWYDIGTPEQLEAARQALKAAAKGSRF